MIKQLPSELIDKIAAGEVVERPSAVIKEILENAIDAGADRIRIDYLEGGLKEMRVVDNGCGIMAEQLPLALKRHATSKLSSLENLFNIDTLGFRGEALPSIAAVSRLKITSRSKKETEGREIFLEGGKTKDDQPAAAKAGTKVVVKNLFYNTPARLKFMGRASSESRYINEVVERYALCYPQVSFQLFSEKKSVYDLPAAANLMVRTQDIYSSSISSEMLYLPPSGDNVIVEAMVSKPTLHRGNRSQINIFVNGRYIKSTKISQAVIEAYRNLLPPRRFPVVILILTLPPKALDVNVHPAKTEVKFASPKEVFSHVYHALKSRLQDGVPGNLGYKQSPLGPNTQIAESQVPEQIAIPSSSLGALSETFSPSSYTIPKQLPKDNSSPEDVEKNIPESFPPKPIQTQRRVIGQVLKTYILAEEKGGLVIYDQHATHERILYEELSKRITAGKMEIQLLLMPVNIKCLPEDAALIKDNLELFSRYGFCLEPFGPNAFVLREVPAVLSRSGDYEELIFDIIDRLTKTPNSDLLGEEFFKNVVELIACRAAIKAGDRLEPIEMTALLNDLDQKEAPACCPHNRPTFIRLSKEVLEKEFLRRK